MTKSLATGFASTPLARAPLPKGALLTSVEERLVRFVAGTGNCGGGRSGERGMSLRSGGIGD